MLIVPLKVGISYDLGHALAQWLDSDLQISFKPQNPLQFILPKPLFHSTDCREELLLLQSTRTIITNAITKSNVHKYALSSSSSENVLDVLYEYHAILLEFEKRGFPSIEDSTTPITIKWKGAYDNQQSEQHHSLVWERAIIMYNIIALLSGKVAYECSYTNREECKNAISYCQQIISILLILKELVKSQEDYIITIDLSINLLSFWEKYFIATTQHYIYRMAILGDNNTVNHTLVASLAESAHILYNDALLAAIEPRIQSELYIQSKLYGTYCKVSSMLLASKAEYHLAIASSKQYQYGIEIARLRNCKEKLTTLQKFIQSIEKNNNKMNADDNDNIDVTIVIENEKKELNTLIPIVNDQLIQVDQDNYTIYQHEIPISLPDIPSKQLVKISSTLPIHMIQYNYKKDPYKNVLFHGL